MELDILSLRLPGYSEIIGDINKVEATEQGKKWYGERIEEYITRNNVKIDMVIFSISDSDKQPKVYGSAAIEAAKNRLGYNDDNCTLYKLFAARINHTKDGWGCITIDNIYKYIKGHITYWNTKMKKCTNWNHYPSNLLQFLLKHQRGDPCPPSPPTA